ncbi:class F sortase [Streptosporangium sandarakinum]
MYSGPSHGGPGPYGHDPHDPYGAGRPPRSARRLLMPALLVVGSLGGIGAIMAGLLTFLSPADEEEYYRAAESQSATGTAPQNPPPPVAAGEENPALTLSAAVGPGGLDGPLTAAAPTAPPPLPVVQPPEPLRTAAGVRPNKLSIGKIGLLAPLTQVGVDAKKEVQTPPLSKPKLAGWYRHGPVPGQQGPSVILGHVNTKSGPAVFSRLKEIKRGDKIKVSRSDKAVVEFTVDGVEQVSKKAFPSKRVYGNTGEATLRLITCGGVYNPRIGHYTDNIIVYATLSKVVRR